jgi:hypothetical protein
MKFLNYRNIQLALSSVKGLSTPWRNNNISQKKVNKPDQGYQLDHQGRWVSPEGKL